MPIPEIESSLEDNDQSSNGVERITRRELIKLGGKIAAAATVSSMFAPFISTSKDAASEALSFWQFYAPGGGSSLQAKWFEQLVKSWNDTHDVKVELVYVPANDYRDGTKLPTAFASGTGPDIFILAPSLSLRYYNGGVLLDLTPFIEEKAREDFFPEVMATRIFDNRIYAIPMEVEPMAIYYSLDAFAEIGLTAKDVPKTWDELLEIAKKLTNSKRFGILFQTEVGAYQNFTWYPFMWQGGGDFLTKEGKSAFNSPATIQALKFWQDTINMGVAPRQALGGGAWDAVPNLAAGYCAMQNVGIWAVAQLRENAPNFKYGVFRLPTPSGGKYVTIGGGWAFVANAKGKNPEAAGRFCAWALGSMSPDSVGRMVDWCTKVKSDMPPRKSALEAGKEAYDQGFLKVFAEEIYPGTRGEPRVSPDVEKVISDAIQACQLNGQSPEQVAATASQQMDAFLATYKGASML
jgi:multiple sugar transport system substrate-binding protein